MFAVVVVVVVVAAALVARHPTNISKLIELSCWLRRWNWILIGVNISKWIFPFFPHSIDLPALAVAVHLTVRVCVRVCCSFNQIWSKRKRKWARSVATTEFVTKCFQLRHGHVAHNTSITSTQTSASKRIPRESYASRLCLKAHGLSWPCCQSCQSCVGLISTQKWSGHRRCHRKVKNNLAKVLSHREDLVHAVLKKFPGKPPPLKPIPCRISAESTWICSLAIMSYLLKLEINSSCLLRLKPQNNNKNKKKLYLFNRLPARTSFKNLFWPKKRRAKKTLARRQTELKRKKQSSWGY